MILKAARSIGIKISTVELPNGKKITAAVGHGLKTARTLLKMEKEILISLKLLRVTGWGQPIVKVKDLAIRNGLYSVNLNLVYHYKFNIITYNFINIY